MEGGCHCGAFRYRVNGEAKNIVNCHCNLCRRMNGSAFATYVAVLAGDFEVLQGETRAIGITDSVDKHVCATCCSPIYNLTAKYEHLRIVHIGSLDEASELTPVMNIYSESKLDWLESIDKFKNFQQGIE